MKITIKEIDLDQAIKDGRSAGGATICCDVHGKLYAHYRLPPLHYGQFFLVLIHSRTKPVYRAIAEGFKNRYNIELEIVNGSVQFWALDVGDTFRTSDGSLFVKTDALAYSLGDVNIAVNAVNVRNGHNQFFGVTNKVYPVKVDFIIKGEH
jgi:hypothetical protein